MSRSQYPYPPDEFDVRGPDDAPVGVHRAPRSKWSSVWPFLLVAVIAVAVAVGGVTFMSRDQGTPADAAPAATKPAATATASPPADDDAAGDAPADGDAAAGADPAESPTPAETPAAPDLSALLQAANLDAHVRVLNAGGPQGEAGRGKTALDGKGFTQVEATNWPQGQTPPASTSVWYAAGKSDTAAAVAAALGIPAENVSQQNVSNGDVLVIIRSALTPAG